MKVHRGWLDRARRCFSPNCDARPPHTLVDLLVIHGISLPPKHFGGPWVDGLFTNTLDIDAHPYFERLAGLRVSAHILIRRDGELVQYVPFPLRAWHAGASCYEGRVACNDFSVGVELEGCDDIPYSDAQYLCLAQVIPVLQREYPAITDRRIVGHSDIAPGRKTDPGPAFDWVRLRAELEGHGE
jgi:AmpD protein